MIRSRSLYKKRFLVQGIFLATVPEHGLYAMRDHCISCRFSYSSPATVNDCYAESTAAIKGSVNIHEIISKDTISI